MESVVKVKTGLKRAPKMGPHKEPKIVLELGILEQFGTRLGLSLNERKRGQEGPAECAGPVETWMVDLGKGIGRPGNEELVGIVLSRPPAR